MHLLQVLAFLVPIRSLQHSQATFGTKIRKKYFQKACTGHCPSEITMLELPMAAWSCPALPLLFAFFYAVAAVNCILSF